MKRWAVGVTAVGAIALAISAQIDPRGALAGAQAASAAAASLALGCILLLLMLPLIEGRWQITLAPTLRMGAALLPWAMIGLWPVLLAAWWLYPKIEPDTQGFRGLWLQPSSIALRGLLYAAVWFCLQRLAVRGIGAAAAGLGVIVMVLSLSAAGIDWLMALDSRFYSTSFGLFYVCRALLMAIALIGLVDPHADPRLVRALLLGCTLLWGYLHFMQYLIAWAGNLPREAAWYQTRTTGGWLSVGWILGLVQAVLCTGLLVSIWACRPNVLRCACGGTLLCGFIEMTWLAVPSLGLAPGLACWSASWVWAGLTALLWNRRRHA